MKDVKESKRIDNLIHTNYQKPFLDPNLLKNDFLEFSKIHCNIVSKGYWPINYEVDGF